MFCACLKIKVDTVRHPTESAPMHAKCLNGANEKFARYGPAVAALAETSGEQRSYAISK